jgi:phosphoglycolate phosphatase-like HAD superfamily hydrolase
VDWKTLHSETVKKVREFYASSDFRYIPPVEGAIEGVRALRQLGFRLVIVTARSKKIAQLTEDWVRVHFPGA